MKSLFFTEEHDLFRSSFRSFLEKEAIPHIDQWEEERRIPKDIWKKMGDMGYLGLGYPAKYGGSELDFFYDVIFTEEVSRCFSGGFAIVQMVVQYMSGPYILKYGSESLKEKYLPGIVSGDLISCIGISEPGAGSDVQNIKTTARREGDFYYVNGSKTFITNAVYGDLIVTVVKTDPDAGPAGVSLLVIDRHAEGVSATKLKKLGWHASDTAELAFDNVKVPAENRIGKEGQGFYYLMGGLQLERLIGAIAGYAASELAVSHALNYMKDRHAFGRPLTKFQVLRHRIAQLASEIESVKQFVLNCSKMHDMGEYVVKECSMAKLLATELSDKTMTQCLQFFGGYGYIEEYKIARMFRDSRIGTIGGGSSEIMREIISKMVIDDVAYQAASLPEKEKAIGTNGHEGNGFASMLENIQASAAKASPLGSVLKFDFGQEKLLIDGRGEQNKVQTEDGEAACTVEVSLADFKSLVKGQLNPMSAMMEGKLKIEGDMGVAMKLQSLFR